MRVIQEPLWRGASPGQVLSADFLQTERQPETNQLFLATLAHELRTPINSIIACARLCLDGMYGPLQPELVRCLERVHDHAERELQLMNDFLDALKLQEGRMGLHRSNVSIELLVHQIQDTFAPVAACRDQHFSIAVDASTPACVVADAERLKQAVFNLLSNALKFTPTSKAVGVRLYVEESRLRIAVRDEGPGLQPDEMDIIMLPYRQGSLARSQHATGLGLGLYITNEVVKLHGGQLRIESEPGQGSRFEIALPLDARLDAR